MPISDQIVDVQADVHIYPFQDVQLNWFEWSFSVFFFFFFFFLLCVTNSALCGDYTAVHVSGIFSKILVMTWKL